MKTEEHTEIIRQATAEDIVSIFSIWKAGQASAMGDTTFDIKMTEEEVKKTFLYNILHQTATFKVWVYEKENSIIAWCSILPFHPNPLLKDTWGIISMYIHPDYQNHIYGYLFSSQVLKAASESSLKYIISVVAADNERIKRLSVKMSFVTLGILPKNEADNPLAVSEIMIFEA